MFGMLYALPDVLNLMPAGDTDASSRRAANRSYLVQPVNFLEVNVTSVDVLDLNID